jgi:hypothetical protein
MVFRVRFAAGVALPACVGFVFGLVALASAEDRTPPYETVPTLTAADAAPDVPQKGPDFTLGPEVHNDGFMNHYALRTTWGPQSVVSLPLLRKRVRETHAIRQIVEISKSETFAKSLGDAGKNTIRGATKLVTEPVDSVSGAVSGVGKMFGIAKQSITSDDRSETEDERWASAVGFSQTKRDFAKELGVDVYTRNENLQKALEELSWAGWSGGMTGGLASMAIPGGIGVAVSLSKSSDLFNRIDVSLPPGEIREINRKKLTAMRIPTATVDRFIGDSTLSPTQQSLVVVAMEEMSGTAGRGNFLDFVARAPDADVASFAVLQAAMYLSYHRGQEPIVRFEGYGPGVVARTADGGVVVLHPMDHLFWTDSAGAIVKAVGPGVADAPRRLLWVGGRVSDTARNAFGDLGWEMREGALAALLGDNAALD